MDPKLPSSSMLFAPAARATEAISFPAHDSSRVPEHEFPPVDQHLVEPEVTRDEVIRGRKVVALPANPPHADAHADLGGVLRWHVGDGYRASLDLLTRVSEGSDFATDFSIRRDGQDPATKTRYLEEVSFEIVNTQSNRDVHEKAAELVARGVRRVFAIFVERNLVCEWSRDKKAFVALERDGSIEDPCFVRPLAVRALIESSIAEREAVRALKQRGSPEIQAIQAEERNAGLQEGRREGRNAGLQEGRKEGLKEGLKEGAREGRVSLLREIMEARFGELPPSVVARLDVASDEELLGWSRRVIGVGTLAELMGVGEVS